MPLVDDKFAFLEAVFVAKRPRRRSGVPEIVGFLGIVVPRQEVRFYARLAASVGTAIIFR